MIAILDYGIGNLGSIKNMLHILGQNNVIYAKDASDIKNADKIILPGVGSFDSGMRALNNSGMREALDNYVLIDKKPILGICLGMQMLGKRSEEGSESGLGYIDFSCKKFNTNELKLRVPHMGWDFVKIKNKNPATNDIPEKLRFYFVHSYYAICDKTEDSWMTCDYGVEFSAAVRNNNVYGTQFHPEKSHKFGKWLFKNFIEV